MQLAIVHEKKRSKIGAKKKRWQQKKKKVVFCRAHSRVATLIQPSFQKKKRHPISEH